MANYGLTWLDRRILRHIPPDWDSRVTSRYIAERMPGLTTLQVAARIKRKLEHRYVESRMVPPYIHRLKPGLILGEDLLREVDL